MPMEIWRSIPGYEGAYEVSTRGRVRSKDRMCPGKNGRSEPHTGKLIKPQRLKSGYYEVSLCSHGKRTHRTIHSLVAEAFLGPRPSGHDVMHLNGDRSDNRLENLNYGTRSENLQSTYSYGGKSANGKLSKEDVINIKIRLRNGESIPSICADYNVHRAAIYHIRSGKTFAHIQIPEVS